MIEDTILQQVHDDWKQRGFPYYPTNKIWRDNIFNQLINFRRDCFFAISLFNNY